MPSPLCALVASCMKWGSDSGGYLTAVRGLEVTVQVEPLSPRLAQSKHSINAGCFLPRPTSPLGFYLPVS